MPMATIEEHPSTSNPLTLTIMLLIQKEMSQCRQGLLLGTYSAPFCSVPAPPRRCMQRMGNFKYETQLFVRSRSSLNRAFDAEILQKFSQKQLYAEQMHPGNIAYALWNQNF